MKSKFMSKVRSQKGFTLVELIVVIAVLGILSLILVPQFSLYGDKAMGTTAKADVKSIISMYTAHNMDSIETLNTKSLAALVGMTTELKANTSYTDASGSKCLESLSTTGATGATANYYYRRGDVILKCVINFSTQAETWSCTLQDIKRFDALASGLKVTGAGSASTAPTATGVGKLAYVAATTFPAK